MVGGEDGDRDRVGGWSGVEIFLLKSEKQRLNGSVGELSTQECYGAARASERGSEASDGSA